MGGENIKEHNKQCELCPICWAISKMQNPEVGMHLRRAGREVYLALRSMLKSEK